MSADTRWQKTRSAWEAWQRRGLAAEDIVRPILDGTVVRVRLDRKATAISLLIALGVRRVGQKVVLAIRNMGGESEAAPPRSVDLGRFADGSPRPARDGGPFWMVCWRAAWPGWS